MLTADDTTTQGNTHPLLFPARDEIVNFCHDLRRTRSIHMIKSLPLQTEASYSVTLYKPDELFSKRNRAEYFRGLVTASKEVCLFDPDNGFEPDDPNRRHLLFSEATEVLGRSPKDSMVSVFQHFRRRPFGEDFADIQRQLGKAHSAALYWHSLMFVLITNDGETLSKVVDRTKNYAEGKPVHVLQ